MHEYVYYAIPVYLYCTCKKGEGECLYSWKGGGLRYPHDNKSIQLSEYQISCNSKQCIFVLAYQPTFAITQRPFSEKTNLGFLFTELHLKGKL
jgi:hypothetical protein